MRTWLITGVSSGFGYEMTKLSLERGDTVVGTVRSKSKVEALLAQYSDTFDCRILDVTDVPAVHKTVDEAFAAHGKIDVVVSNAGYGLFGAAEELSDAEIDHIIATDLVGSIQLIRSALPHMRKQGGGRIIQISSYGGQVAYAANSMYHACKFGIEGFCESVAQEVAKFGIGMTIVEPGGAHGVPLRQRKSRPPHARIRPCARLSEHARFLQGACARRPCEDGGAHHRKRREKSRAPENGAGQRGAQGDDRAPGGAPCRL